MHDTLINYSVCINKEENAHAGNATQNIHPPLMQDTHTHTTKHTASLIHLQVKIHERHIHKAKMTMGVPSWHGQ